MPVLFCGEHAKSPECTDFDNKCMLKDELLLTLDLLLNAFGDFSSANNSDFLRKGRITFCFDFLKSSVITLIKLAKCRLQKVEKEFSSLQGCLLFQRQS